MILKFVICALLLICAGVADADTASTDVDEDDWQPFLDALWEKEGSSRLHPPDGDGGKAIGPYQIWESYWIDASRHDKSLTENGGNYQSCRDKAYAERVIRAYMDRWDRKSWTGVVPSWESKARLHNGGCNIYKKRGKTAWKNTTAYWKFIKAHMDRVTNYSGR